MCLKYKSEKHIGLHVDLYLKNSETFCEENHNIKKFPKRNSSASVDIGDIEHLLHEATGRLQVHVLGKLLFAQLDVDEFTSVT